jgi:hypothetical protein
MKVKVTKKGALLTPFYLNINSNVNFVLFTTIDLLKMFTPKCLGFLIQGGAFYTFLNEDQGHQKKGPS